MADYSQRVIVNGSELSLTRDVNMSFVALEKFDPIHDPEPAPQQQVHVIDFDYVREEIVFSSSHRFTRILSAEDAEEITQRSQSRLRISANLNFSPRLSA